MSGKYRKEHNCLNCGAHVEEHYCSRCGQPNLELKESFWTFVSHSIAHYFHFDNKFFQTLVPLVTKPGQVTLDFLAGKRARYINPVSMYIFVSIVYFLLAYSGEKKERHEEESVKIDTKAADQKMEKAAKDVPALKKVIEKGKQNVMRSAITSNFKLLSFAEQRSVLTLMKSEIAQKPTDSIESLYTSLNDIHILRNDSTYDAYLARQKTLIVSERDNWLERIMMKRSIEIGNKGEKIQEMLEHNRPKQYFLFMPLMALFIMFNFRKNHIYYLDHLIFTIHGMTAFFLVQIFTKPLIKYIFGEGSLIAGILEFGVFLWIIWYMYKALTIFYKRKRWTTIWRMLWIIILYAAALGLSEMVIVNVIYYTAV